MVVNLSRSINFANDTGIAFIREPPSRSLSRRKTRIININNNLAKILLLRRFDFRIPRQQVGNGWGTSVIDSPCMLTPESSYYCQTLKHLETRVVRATRSWRHRCTSKRCSSVDVNVYGASSRRKQALEIVEQALDSLSAPIVSHHDRPHAFLSVSARCAESVCAIQRTKRQAPRVVDRSEGDGMTRGQIPRKQSTAPFKLFPPLPPLQR